jgi:ubiquinone/menaquinone biosynthesis C-methylase UbiE
MQIGFGYPWWLTHGHLVITAVALPLLLLGRARRWPKVPMILLGTLALWSLAAFATARFVLDFDGVPSLPTETYLASGSGRVLDMGAGTGRSTLMVLEARPQTRVVALDLFAHSYQIHFGPGPSGQERLLANLRKAGVENRAEIQAGDMRELPFEAETFDAIVSAYAVDHLNGEGITAALSEASRVLKPGGEFLLMVVGREFWLNLAFGPLLLHSHIRSPEGWADLLRDAGFQIIEQGTKPATFYVLARKP